MVFPNKVYMTGLPFRFRYLNGEYKKTEQEWNDAPIYQYTPKLLFFQFHSIRIMNYDGIWTLVRHGELPSESLIRKLNESHNLTGVWTYGVVKDIEPSPGLVTRVTYSSLDMIRRVYYIMFGRFHR